MNIQDIRQTTSILFDFDGVIADTETGRYEAYCDIFEEYGYDLRSRCVMTDLAGFTGDGFMNRFFPEIPPAVVMEMVCKRQVHYMDHLDRFCKPFPGARQTIADLKREGYYLALTTANATAVARQLLEVVGVLEYFDAVCGREICEDPVTKVKDYSRMPAQINKITGECVVIEDSPVGVAGAKRSGFYCVAFAHFEDAVIEEQADVVVHDFNELRKLFGLSEINLK
ncbi:MAG: HAD family phosphatase [Bacteroidales bacterium]|jgi:beta-phosphoglucomutase-like phosphatase (HAD superfamily)|nr:HAD family phosphatase [Bacteroidales bacterium]